MRSRHGMGVPAAVSCAAAALAGCTIHSEPARFTTRAEVGVGTPVAAPPARPAYDVSVSASVAPFHDALAPAGQWLEAPVCGGRFGPVWRPDPRVVGPDFVPYRTGGEWVSTDQGWAFVSDHEWGWATYHYGRWCPDPRYGWVWVPGSEWAPAWVDWQYGGGYVGWAPLPPAGVALSDHHWTFVERPNFAGRRVTHHAIPRERVIHARRVTRPVGRVVRQGDHSWSAGPPPEEIDRSARPVHVVPPARGSVRPVIIRRH